MCLRLNNSNSVPRIDKGIDNKLNHEYSILVNIGPGSFSSLRISLSVAKGIQIVHGSNLYGYKNNQLPDLKLENIPTQADPEPVIREK